MSRQERIIACARGAQPKSPQLVGPAKNPNPQQNQEPPPGLDPQRTRTPNKTKNHHPNQELYTYGIIHRITGPTLIPTKTGFHNCTEAQCLTNRASAHKPSMRIEPSRPSIQYHEDPNSIVPLLTYSLMPDKQDQYTRQTVPTKPNHLCYDQLKPNSIVSHQQHPFRNPAISTT